MIRILSRIKSEPWAITREVMDTIMDIAQRENMSPEAVAQKLGRPLENTYDVEIRDGIAILPIQGPLFRYANLFTMISGATSYDKLATDFAQAVENPRVSAILLNIDSPGGEANGVSEFADHIAAARGKKPIIAYVGGVAASAAYWLASAADEIVISDTALLGSIGTVMSITDTRERDAKAGVKRYEVVSSQSPYKRVDVATEDGQSRIQVLVDSLSDVFVTKVANYRGTDVETVLKNYGQGDVLVGQAAVGAGLADRIGSFEAVIAELQGQSSGSGVVLAAARGSNQGVVMTTQSGAHGAENSKFKSGQQALEAKSKSKAAEGDEEEEEEEDEEEQTSKKSKTKVKGKPKSEENPDDEDEEEDDEKTTRSASSERARIRNILSSAEAHGRSEMAHHLAFSTSMSSKEAIALLATAPKENKAGGFASFDAAMRREGNPAVGADSEPGNEADALIQTAKQLGLA